MEGYLIASEEMQYNGWYNTHITTVLINGGNAYVYVNGSLFITTVKGVVIPNGDTEEINYVGLGDFFYILCSFLYYTICVYIQDTFYIFFYNHNMYIIIF